MQTAVSRSDDGEPPQSETMSSSFWLDLEAGVTTEAQELRLHPAGGAAGEPLLHPGEQSEEKEERKREAGKQSLGHKGCRERK